MKNEKTITANTEILYGFLKIIDFDWRSGEVELLHDRMYQVQHIHV